ncbi:MAG: phosphonate ABC transporter ATP-binding protein [Microbacteriaceae bacterium]|jgi:phosphonate transport system ATP-binding protein|nr:phosphonate ABC transporter ATP-binding protein [Microbacteriaceae bacterium]MDR9444024.1 phosphonate ABC transporter ATP-binding protein [Microbacteriaceae bacterium]
MISFQNVSVEYRPGEKALDEINLEIKEGEFVVVVGLSGAGKSTLIRSINNLVPITSGELVVDEESVGKLSRSGVRKLRSKIGMIFQGFNLVDRASVIQNVLMGRVYKLPTWRTVFGFYPKKDKQIAAEALNRVGLLEKSHSRATDLSGGQRQRVGIARALSQEPRLILADEPVASLDPPTSHAVMQHLQKINRDLGITTIVNLHFLDLATKYGERIIGLRDGKVVFDGKGSECTPEVFEGIYGRSLTADDTLQEEV